MVTLINLFIIIVFKGFNANVMIIPDKSKSGRVERASGDWIKRKKKDETNY